MDHKDQSGELLTHFMENHFGDHVKKSVWGTLSLVILIDAV